MRCCFATGKAHRPESSNPDLGRGLGVRLLFRDGRTTGGKHSSGSTARNPDLGVVATTLWLWSCPVAAGCLASRCRAGVGERYLTRCREQQGGGFAKGRQVEGFAWGWVEKADSKARKRLMGGTER